MLVALGVILLTCGLEIVNSSFFTELECKTYDARVRYAQNFQKTASNTATNLGFVVISDQTIDSVNNGLLGGKFGLYWPRHVYGRALNELSAQGAKAVAFDVIFAERRRDHAPVRMPDESLIDSDVYFATALKNSSNTVLAADEEVMPDRLFETNAWRVGNFSVQSDLDGVLRRDRPYRDIRVWNPYVNLAASEFGFDLSKTKIESDKITFIRKRGEEPVSLPLDERGMLSIKEFDSKPPKPGAPTTFLPYRTYRAWSLGIALAACELKLDLDNARVEKNRIVLEGPNGLQRVIPLDADGNYLIDWSIGLNDPALAKGGMEELLQSHMDRAQGKPVPELWRGKLVLIGSVATGNDLKDMGPTPLEPATYLASKHWNVANSVITGRFITATPLWVNLLLIVLAGGVAAWTAWVARSLTGSLLMLFFIVLYGVLSLWLFERFRIWIPVVLPLGCCALGTHLCSVVYRVRVELTGRKQLKHIFSKLVSPNIVNELLKTGTASLGGDRREVTVMFTDVRGFTEMTDSAQASAEEYAKLNKLTPKEANAYYSHQAQEVLTTISSCLGIVANIVKRHEGTLDKYIGDSVMAFWGAPTADPQQAVHCVRAAMEAQRALEAFNARRAEENKRIEAGNPLRVKSGLPPRPLLSMISMGTGINTGSAIAGLMGSDADIVNYTVFGREINLAARLEGVSGSGRIVIGEGTYLALRRDDPELAAACIELTEIKVKGFRGAIRAYEVPWC